MVERPSFDPLDWLAIGSAVGVLLFAYVIYPGPIVQFTAWTIVLTIYMVWFCYYGVKWLYEVYL